MRVVLTAREGAYADARTLASGLQDELTKGPPSSAPRQRSETGRVAKRLRRANRARQQETEALRTAVAAERARARPHHSCARQQHTYRFSVFRSDVER